MEENGTLNEPEENEEKVTWQDLVRNVIINMLF